MIRMAREPNQIMIEIRDEGKGVSPERLTEIQPRRSGVGIRGMRERLRQFDGTMNIESDSSVTRVVATIPVPKVSSSEDERAEPLPASA